jgi:NAD(P)-dependent dehydrogenase (short-subunit alcohol dehydrogenase family)
MKLSQVLSLELDEHAIRSNIVAPALVWTPFSDFPDWNPEPAQRRESMIPVERNVTRSELPRPYRFSQATGSDTPMAKKVMSMAR